MGAPYGGRFGDPAAIEALAEEVSALAAQVDMLTPLARSACDFNPQAFSGPLVDGWRMDGLRHGQALRSASAELRSIAGFLEGAAATAWEAIKAQQARDRAEAARRNARHDGL